MHRRNIGWNQIVINGEDNYNIIIFTFVVEFGEPAEDPGLVVDVLSGI